MLTTDRLEPQFHRGAVVATNDKRTVINRHVPDRVIWLGRTRQEPNVLDAGVDIGVRDASVVVRRHVSRLSVCHKAHKTVQGVFGGKLATANWSGGLAC